MEIIYKKYIVNAGFKTLFYSGYVVEDFKNHILFYDLKLKENVTIYKNHIASVEPLSEEEVKRFD